ncbi:MAG: M56 family metallopeptidase, partial [Verrucomicrobiia bacterium]
MRESLSHIPLLLKMSGEASMLILLVLAAQWLCGQRLQPRWRHALWLLVMVRLALPWSIPTPASLFNVVKIPASASHVQASPILDRSTSVPVAIVQSAATVGSFTGEGWRAWLVWVWTAGAVSLAGCALACQYWFNRRIRRLRPLTDGSTLGLFEDCKTLMGVSTPVSLIETEAVKSPTLCGFVRPRLLLPTGLIAAHYRSTCQFTKALAAWQQVWALGKNITDLNGRQVVDESVS